MEKKNVHNVLSLCEVYFECKKLKVCMWIQLNFYSLLKPKHLLLTCKSSDNFDNVFHRSSTHKDVDFTGKEK